MVFVSFCREAARTWRGSNLRGFPQTLSDSLSDMNDSKTDLSLVSDSCELRSVKVIRFSITGIHSAPVVSAEYDPTASIYLRGM